MSDSDEDYGPLPTSWGAQAEEERETKVNDWSSLLDPNIKVGPNDLGSGNLHRKGQNFKPIDEEIILAQRKKIPIPKKKIQEAIKQVEMNLGLPESSSRKSKKKSKPVRSSKPPPSNTKKPVENPVKQHTPLIPSRPVKVDVNSKWSSLDLVETPFWEEAQPQTSNKNNQASNNTMNSSFNKSSSQLSNNTAAQPSMPKTPPTPTTPKTPKAFTVSPVSHQAVSNTPPTPKSNSTSVSSTVPSTQEFSKPSHLRQNSRENSREIRKEPQREYYRDSLKESTKEVSRESSREAVKESHKETLRDGPRYTPREKKHENKIENDTWNTLSDDSWGKIENSSKGTLNESGWEEYDKMKADNNGWGDVSQDMNTNTTFNSPSSLHTNSNNNTFGWGSSPNVNNHNGHSSYNHNHNNNTPKNSSWPNDIPSENLPKSSTPRFSIASKQRYSAMPQEDKPEPINYKRDGKLSLPTQTAPPPPPENRLLIMVNVELTDGVKIPVSIRELDDPLKLAQEFAIKNNITKEKIIEALFNLFSSQKETALKLKNKRLERRFPHKSSSHHFSNNIHHNFQDYSTYASSPAYQNSQKTNPVTTSYARR